MSDRNFKPIRTLTDKVRRPASHPARGADPRPPTAAERYAEVRARASLVDSAVYVEGDRVESPETLADTYRALHTHESAVGWRCGAGG